MNARDALAVPASSVTPAGWRALWRELGAARADESLFQRLVAAWSEPHRHYHTLQHLRECLERFDAVRALARRPAEIELALWFHDAVYDVRRHDNEARSADLARDAVLAAGLGEAMARRVHALVMATRHQDPVEDADAQLLVDVDLSILGAARARFDESDEQIRREYGHLPEPQYRAGRREVLRGFLARPRIYSTPGFVEAFEQRARANLGRALDRLGP